MLLKSKNQIKSKSRSPTIVEKSIKTLCSVAIFKKRSAVVYSNKLLLAALYTDCRAAGHSTNRAAAAACVANAILSKDDSGTVVDWEYEL